MDLLSAETVRYLLLSIPALILSLSFHEFAHAFAADKLGDRTARYMGRLTMDPMSHISLMGTVVLPAFLALAGAPAFGWANPVPVDMRNFKKPRLGMAIVAAAGPASNILLAFVLAGVLKLMPDSAWMATGGMWRTGAEMLGIAITLNLVLAFFNLFPLPPLDGSRIVQGFVGRRMADSMDALAPYSFMIFMLLYFTGIFSLFLRPLIYIGLSIIQTTFDLAPLALLRS